MTVASMTVLAINGDRHDVEPAAELGSLNDYIRLNTRFKVCLTWGSFC